jgi:hypothetical protein
MRYASLILLLTTLPVSAQTVPPKAAIPADDAQKATVSVIAAVYKPDYEKAKTTPQKIELAKKLLNEGTATRDDVVGRFVLWRIARDIAAQQGDLALAFNAIGRMSEEFEIDRIQMRIDAATVAVKVPKLAKDHQAIAAMLAPIIEEAIAADRYPQATTLAELTLVCAREGRDLERAKHMALKSKEIEEIAAEFEKVQEATAVLRNRPTDPAANFAVGKFLCFVKGDWRQGVTMLALSDKEDEVRAAALLELGAKPDGLQLGDAWWKIGESLEGMSKARSQAHAAQWYRQSLGGLSGLTKARVESRLKEIAANPNTADHEAASGAVDLTAAERQTRLEERGGTAASEAAVAKALDWLANHQMADGGWNYDHRNSPCNARCSHAGNLTDCRTGATAQALLPFLGAGQTHKQGKYKKQVEAGLRFLNGQMKVKSLAGMQCGDLSQGGGTMYSHGLAAMVLCEAYEKTRDNGLKQPAQLAVNHIAYAQDPVGGGWRYAPRTPGDTSVLAWQLPALKSAARAGLPIPAATMKGANQFLDSVMTDEAYYGYTDPGRGTATTAIGLLSRMHLGWKKDHAGLKKGVQFLSQTGPSAGNIYFNYHATQCLSQYEGEHWDKWNKKMRDLLVNSQEQADHLAGSWHMRGDHGTERGGRLYVTSMAALILEVYYQPSIYAQR